MKRTVSIIIPVWNAEKYLKKCLSSALGQTYRDIEVIVINDASTDSTGAIIGQYASIDSRLKVITNWENTGVGLSRRAGLSLACGEYIIFLDADDWLEPYMCACMAAAAEKTGADMIRCGSNIIAGNPDSPIAGKRHVSWEDTKNMDGLHKTGIELIASSSKMLWGALFRKDLIDKYSLTFPDMRIGEDEYFVLCYLLAAKDIFFTGRKLYNHLKREDSLVALNVASCVPEREMDRFSLLAMVCEFAKQAGLTERYGVLNEIYYRILHSVLDNILTMARKCLQNSLSKTDINILFPAHFSLLPAICYNKPHDKDYLCGNAQT